LTFSKRMSGLASGLDQGAKARRTAPTEADLREGGGKMLELRPERENLPASYDVRASRTTI
jgi:hypothetical protein